MTEILGKQIQLVGDDRFRHQHPPSSASGIDEGLANSILVKVNQIGTLTETSRRDRVLASRAMAIPR